MGATPLMKNIRSLKKVITGVIVGCLVAGMGAIGATPAHATPTTVNVTVSCSANTDVYATTSLDGSGSDADTVNFTFAPDCPGTAQIINYESYGTVGFLPPTKPVGAGGSNSAWYFQKSSNPSFSSFVVDFNAFNSNISVGDTIAIVVPDISTAAMVSPGVVTGQVSIRWQGPTAPVSATPSISTQPAGVAKTVGDSLSLSVAATASDGGTLSYAWKKDGNALSGATSATLSIPNVSTGDAGSYTVDVTNTHNSDTPTTITSSAAVVTVSAAVSAPAGSSGSGSSAVVAGGSKSIKKSATFKSGPTALNASAKKSAKEVFAIAGKSGTYVVTGAAGKTSTASNAQVRKLAKKRAEVIKAYLVKLGVPATSITIKTKIVKTGKKPKVTVKALY